jgi:hypothetical protein
MRRLLPLLVTVPLLAACIRSGHDPALVEALTEGTDAAGMTLYAPPIDGDEATSFRFHTSDNSVTLDYGEGFTPALTLRAAREGDLCDGREPEYDRCQRIDDDAVRLSFEEMDAVVVRLDGTELSWSNISFEVPDESYPTEEALVAAIEAKVQTYVDGAREAEPLTVAEFLDEVPEGEVEVP